MTLKDQNGGTKDVGIILSPRIVKILVGVATTLTASLIMSGIYGIHSVMSFNAKWPMVEKTMEANAAMTADHHDQLTAFRATWPTEIAKINSNTSKNASQDVEIARNSALCSEAILLVRQVIGHPTSNP